MTVTNSNVRKTNWFVVTGAPSSGKTTTVNLLRDRGYRTTIEHARHFIDTQRVSGKTVEEIRRNQAVFQLGVLEMQLEEERALPTDEIVFLDRALPDALAYYRLLQIEPDAKLVEALQRVSYAKIFILDPLPLVKDYARLEDEATQRKIHDLLVDVYQSLGFPVEHVPVLEAAQRVDFILSHLEIPVA
jgi:predicted ATPase